MYNEDDDHHDHYYHNVYNCPDKFGLETIATIDYSDGNYCFDLRAVWKEAATGWLFTARDAGCSCPSPFEEYKDLNSLLRITDTSMLENEYKQQRLALTEYHNDSNQYDFPNNWPSFIMTVSEALAASKRK